MKKLLKKKSIIICLVLFIIGVPVMSFVMIHNLYASNFARVGMPEYTGWLRYDDLTGYDRKMVEFKSGENMLTGYIYGEENTKGLVVIAHGLGGGAESYTAETVYFVDAGWKVFAYDCTGSYRSEGDSTMGLPQSALDLDAALCYVEEQDWGLPVMLYGHSWGGYAVGAVLNYDHDITAAVSISGYATPMALLDEQSSDIMGWLAKVLYPFESIYQKVRFGDAADLSAIDGINKSGIPVMIVHGTEDEAIKYDGAAIIAHKDEITNPQAVYKVCDTKDHNNHNNLFMSDASVEYVTEVNAEYETLYEKYEGEIPDDEKEKFYAGVDKFLTSGLDMDFMNDVNTFFENGL